LKKQHEPLCEMCDGDGDGDGDDTSLSFVDIPSLNGLSLKRDTFDCVAVVMLDGSQEVNLYRGTRQDKGPPLHQGTPGQGDPFSGRGNRNEPRRKNIDCI
jgi:hypothetical protein